MPIAAISISFHKFLRRVLSTSLCGSCLSRKGSKSSITSLGNRTKRARTPARSGWRLKAAKRIAKGGQYSTQRRERKLAIIKIVEKARKKSGRLALSLSEESKAA